MAGRWKDIEDQIDERRGKRVHGDPKDRPREKKSWREIDAQRDGTGRTDSGGQHGSPGGKQKNRYAEAMAEKAAKAELADLFVDKKSAQLSGGILGADDRAELQTAVDDWFEQKGDLPADAQVLDKALDVRRDATLRKVVSSIEAAMDALDDVAKKMLMRKMQTKARRSFDAKLSKQIAELLAAHDFDES